MEEPRHGAKGTESWSDESAPGCVAGEVIVRAKEPTFTVRYCS
jgi:hypothetical protein